MLVVVGLVFFHDSDPNPMWMDDRQAHYPEGAMSRGMEHASPSQRFGYSSDFFERPIHIPRKRRTSMGRRMRKLRKVEIW